MKLIHVGQIVTTKVHSRMEIRFSFRQYIILQEQESRSDLMYSALMQTVRSQSTGM